jgi:hypothetical protein
MIIESGLIVALGMLFMFWKCSWKRRMWMLSNPLMMDVAIFVILNWIHWGTFSGVMTAATGALICSALISIGRKCYGHIDRRIYYPGLWSVDVEKLK